MLDAKTRTMLDSIFLRTRKALKGRPSGPMKVKLPSGGMDFIELREYEPGDEVRHIDWKSSSRAGRILIKKFIHDQEISLQIIADVGPRMNYSTTDITKKQVAAEIATALAWVATSSGNRFSFFKLNKYLECSFEDAKGEKEVRALGAILLQAPSSLKETGLNVWKSLAQKQMPRSLVFILSDFYEIIPEGLFASCSKKHDLHLIRILDPREISLPRSADISAKNSGDLSATTIYSSNKDFRDRYQVLFEQHENKIKNLCKKVGAGFIRFTCLDPFLKQLVNYLNSDLKN